MLAPDIRLRVTSMKPFTFLYYFESTEMLLVEVKITDDTLPRNKKYHWLLYNKCENSFRRLSFREMTDDVRVFEEGKLKFDDTCSSLNIGERVYNFKNYSHLTPPDSFISQCKLFLGSICES